MRGCYRRETELGHSRSQAYFHFLVTDFLQDNRSLGVCCKKTHSGAAASVKLSGGENSHLRGGRKMASHSSRLGTRFQCSRVLFIMHEGYLVRAAVADAKIEFKQLSDCLICKESITTFHFSETHTERHP